MTVVAIAGTPGPLRAPEAVRAPEQLALAIFEPDLFPRSPDHGTLSAVLALRAARESVSPPAPSVASLRECSDYDSRQGLSAAMPSEACMVAFAEFFGDRHPPADEVAALRAAPAAVVGAIAARLASASGFVRRPPTRIEGGDAPANPATVRAGLRSSLHALPETSLEPDGGDLLPALDVATVTRAAALGHPILVLSALGEALVFRRASPSAPLGPVIAAWEGVAELVAEADVDPCDPRALGAVMGPYARAEILPEHAPALRKRVLGRIRAARNGATVYATDHEEHGQALLDAMVPLPVIPESGRRAVTDFVARHTRECARNRKRAARAITRNLDRALAAGVTRLADARALSEACGEAARQMRSDGLTGALEFGYDVRDVRTDGMPGSAEISVQLRVHWACEASGELDAGGAVQSPLALPGDVGRVAVSFDPATEPLLFVFVRADVLDDDDVEAAVDRTGGPYVPPLFRLFRDAVFLAPGGLDQAVLERRHDRLAGLDLPFPGGRPAGLLGPDGAAEAALHRRSVNAGMIPVAPFAFYHGLLFALACALMITSSFARAGEVRQAVHDETGWTTDGAGRFAADAFYATPKGQALRKRFRISPGAFRSLCELVEFSLRRDGLEELALSPPSPDLQRKCGDARYVFAFRGRMLTIGDLNYLLAFLFAGIAAVRTHDLRHAAAVRARDEGATEADVACWMNVVGGSVGHYCNDPDDPDDPDADGGDEAERILRQFDWFDMRADIMTIAGTGAGIGARSGMGARVDPGAAPSRAAA